MMQGRGKRAKQEMLSREFHHWNQCWIGGEGCNKTARGLGEDRMKSVRNRRKKKRRDFIAEEHSVPNRDF